MRFQPRDFIGVAVVGCAIGLLSLHQSDRHQAGHLDLGDADEPTSTAVDERVTVFAHVRLMGPDGDSILGGRAVVIRGRTVSWVGPVEELTTPEGATVLNGDGTQLLLAGGSGGHHQRAIRAGDPADIVVVSEDPAVRPAALEAPLCVMRQGVVVSLSPSLEAAG